MSTKIHEMIAPDGKQLRKYETTRQGKLHGWLIGESPEEICRAYGLKLEEYDFVKQPLSMWDIGDNIPVKEKEE